MRKVKLHGRRHRWIALAAGLVLAAPHPAAGQEPVPPSFRYDRSAPLDLQDQFLSDSGGVALHEISYASPGGGRATGLLFVPARSGKVAGIVLQHGAPGSARNMARMGMVLAAHGAVVVAIDAPWARRSGSLLHFTPEDSVEQVQLIQDLQRAVDLLLARPEVDPARLAYLGVSFGGATGSLFSGIERRLKAYVLVVGDGGWVSHFSGPEDAGGPLSQLPQSQRDRWLAAMNPIEGIRFVGGAAPAALLLQSGRQDRLVPPADAERLHQAASEPKTVLWYDAGHGLNAAAERDRLAWLHTMIGTDEP